MTREDAGRLADTLNEMMWTYRDDPTMLPGLRMAAVGIAYQIEVEGKMGGRPFLKRAGALGEPTMPETLTLRPGRKTVGARAA